MRKIDELSQYKSCLNQAASNEPIFVLRANDVNAPATVRTWAQLYEREKGGRKNMTAAQIEKLEAALQLATEMEIFKRRKASA